MSGIKWTKVTLNVSKKQAPVLYKVNPATSGSREVIELRDKEMSLLGMIERGKNAEASKEAIETDIHLYLQGCLKVKPDLFG
ncbi:hypothetical protein M3P05_02445 [Sansalvadorimonas sp. 2012CJ34-2]|uniref:Uncharacterized protein n=1 Tax=Parendozoicomonas callyspongiae TaxID=2942213 RepID=A0ABT0PBR2_9GAMM|nr:hypothetical protein [Sansalvadorimonas sp. 2012CJ34-2]MCL6268809.1 hypothetical protein [Sansalvadorimonas sp. 2012CJ34-2]